MQRIKTFIKALFWHVYSGCPKSKTSLIEHRFSICKACQSYDQTNQRCLECGCNITNKKRFLNKLAWADQKCPLDKW